MLRKNAESFIKLIHIKQKYPCDQSYLCQAENGSRNFIHDAKLGMFNQFIK